MKLNQVGYLTEDPAKEYSKGLDHVRDLGELKTYLDSWEGLADDAKLVIIGWTDKRFFIFKKSLVKERRGIYSGDDEIAPILLPCRFSWQLGKLISGQQPRRLSGSQPR